MRVQVPPGVPRESEPARVLGLAANECAAPAVSFEYCALRSWKVDRGNGARLEGSGQGESPAHVRSVYLPPWRMKPSGYGRPFEAGWAGNRWDSSSPSSAQGCAIRLLTAPGSNPGRRTLDKSRWSSGNLTSFSARRRPIRSRHGVRKPSLLCWPGATGFSLRARRGFDSRRRHSHNHSPGSSIGGASGCYPEGPGSRPGRGAY
jgi:hypothetical protein